MLYCYTVFLHPESYNYELEIIFLSKLDEADWQSLLWDFQVLSIALR
jgi:hypothetical protein